MRVPTPVMSRTNAIDNGSRSRPTETSYPPTAKNWYSTCSIARSSAPRAASAKNRNAATMKEDRTVSVPSTCPQESARRPASSRITAPARGNPMSSQMREKTPSAGVGTCSLMASAVSAVTWSPSRCVRYSFSRLASSTEAERRLR